MGRPQKYRFEASTSAMVARQRLASFLYLLNVASRCYAQQQTGVMECPGYPGRTWAGEWSVPKGQQQLWSPIDPCPYTVLDYDARVRCLTGKHIVFLGDALSRFQYINLAYYLYTGRWSSPHPVNECVREWPDWDSFEVGVPIRLGCHEHCDCVATNGDVHHRREARYFRDCERQLSLTMFLWYAGLPLKLSYGDNSMPPHGVPTSSNSTSWGAFRAPGECRQKVWSCADANRMPSAPVHSYVDAVDFLESEMVPEGRPKADVLIVNQGHWPYPPLRTNSTHRDRLFQAAMRSVKPGGRAMWKTTSVMRRLRGPKDGTEWLAAARAAGLEIFDAYGYTGRLAQYDHAFCNHDHILAPMYKELNMRLLDQLCGA